ncbi:hypothetical protein EUX98_g267 [Antrodiella citrinella]|uniref:U4/U6.U5 small nuclear ribonucleoprotein 27kDa protein domain-containing protein n=1 Tax=Antrodiella citrinella TaxID=2447956 RepID=A0A4S4N651_9APHY|nr:hypothetical protein EUX98_g267 [Antrodiella citrinella]
MREPTVARMPSVEPPVQAPPAAEASSSSHPVVEENPRIDSEGPAEDGEEEEAMEAINPDDEAMMAMMGMSGFGTTKECNLCI